MNTETLAKTGAEPGVTSPVASSSFEDPERRRLERMLLWSAIGLAGALLLLLLLGTVGLLQGRALQISGTVLVWLCAVLIVAAVVSAMKYVARN